ncbi:MAG: prolyl oligopeptidase family serine peptidase [Phycisphaerae bacterium]
MPDLRPVALDDLFRLNVVGRVAISPDGGCVVFEQKRYDLAANKNTCQLMAVDVDTGRVRELTGGGQKDTRPRWSRDGTHLAFISDREKAACLYVLPMDGGEPKRVTDRDGNVQEFDWSPDGRRLVYTYQPMSEREKLERDGKHDELKKKPQFKHITRLFHKLDGAGWWNGQYTHVHIVNRDGTKPRPLTDGDFDDREPRFSPDGKWISFVANRRADPDRDPDHADVFVIRPAGGRPRNITNMSGPKSGHAWSPDGKSIAFVGCPGPSSQTHKHLERVWIVPSRGGAARVATPDVRNDCRNTTLSDTASAAFETTPVIWSRDGNRIFFLISERGATRLYSRSLEPAELRCEFAEDVNVMFVDAAARTGRLAMSMGTATSPGDVYIHDAESPDAARTVAELNKTVLSELDIRTPESIEVDSDGVAIQAWVLKPPDFNPRRKYPAILEIHGGPTAQYGYGFFHELQWLAAGGYIVVYSNPRGSTGYGLKFRNCIHADWGKLDYQDVMRVADWMFKQPFVDSKRIGVTGGSYGGYMTNWLIGHTSRFRAAVSQRALTSFESMFGTSDYGYEMANTWRCAPWQPPRKLREQSPLRFVRHVRTPLLIEHEEEDLRCPIEQAEQYFIALKMLGRDVEMVRFEGESHGLSRTGRPQNRAERLRRIKDWFDRKMK